MKKLNIVHLIYDDPQNPWCGGGGSIRTQEINRRLARSHSVTVITGRWQGAKDEEVDGVRFLRVGSDKSYMLSRITYALNAGRAACGLPFDLLVNDFSGYSPVFPKSFTAKPVISIKHHIMGRHSFGKNPILGVFPYLFEKLDLKQTRYFVSVSPGQSKHIIEKYGSDKVVQTIYNGISGDLLNLEPEEEPYILFLGRMDIYMKGLDILLNAMGRLTQSAIPLKMAGICSPQNRRKLDRLIQKHNVESKVEILGFVAGEEKKELLRKCMFVVMPSRFEGWGIVAVEAAAASKPVIGTRISGLSDAILHNTTGLLIASENANELAIAMKTLFDDSELRHRMGLAGRGWARRFNWEEIAQKQEMFYYYVVSEAAIPK